MNHGLISATVLPQFSLLFLQISQDQKTPLHVACEKGHADVTEYLLAHDASMETKDNSGNTPLHIAAQNQQTRIVQLLLDSGADPDPENAVGRLLNILLVSNNR